MSVAKKNNWLFRSKEVHYVNDGYSIDRTQIKIADNYIFYGNDEHLAVRVINLDNGKTVSEKTLVTWKEAINKYYYLINTKDHPGVLFQNDIGKYSIYLGGELSNPISIEDPKEVLDSQLMSYSHNIVLTTKRDRLVFSNVFGSTVYNIKKKDMIYDEKGHVKNFSGASFYAAGKFYSLSSVIFPTLLTFDENFKPLSSTAFKVKDQYLTNNAGTTVSGNMVHFWNYNEFKKTNSLQVTSLNLGK